MTAPRVLDVVSLPGLTDYTAALEWQRELARARADGDLENDLLILLEHPHVITLGRGAREANLIGPPERLDELGIEIHEIERGGDVTYHGPGQLVGYPILDLRQHRKDLHWYLRQIEAALIHALDGYGVQAGRVEGYTGVWVEDRKIASIGVHVGRWVTWHGFALNVSTDLSRFDLIVPCGIPAVRMTSLVEETARSELDPESVGSHVADALGATFGLRPRTVRAEALVTPPPAIPVPKSHD